MTCPYCDYDCSPHQKLIDVQYEYREKTQDALDAFHKPGAAHEIIEGINRISVSKVKGMSQIENMFISKVRLHEDSDWNKIKSFNERLLFEYN
jgi:mannose/fructose/N-acetylgalactosamine-specific phosphotransferase system component IIB